MTGASAALAYESLESVSELWTELSRSGMPYTLSVVMVPTVPTRLGL